MSIERDLTDPGGGNAIGAARIMDSFNNESDRLNVDGYTVGEGRGIDEDQSSSESEEHSTCTILDQSIARQESGLVAANNQEQILAISNLPIERSSSLSSSSSDQRRSDFDEVRRKSDPLVEIDLNEADNYQEQDTNLEESQIRGQEMFSTTYRTPDEDPTSGGEIVHHHHNHNNGVGPTILFSTSQQQRFHNNLYQNNSSSQQTFGGFGESQPKLSFASQRVKEYFESFKSHRGETVRLYQFFKSTRTELVACLLFCLITSQALIVIRSNNQNSAFSSFWPLKINTNNSQESKQQTQDTLPAPTPTLVTGNSGSSLPSPEVSRELSSSSSSSSSSLSAAVNGVRGNQFQLLSINNKNKLQQHLQPNNNGMIVQLANGLVMSFTVASLTQVFGHISGCHLIPSISLALYVKGHISRLRLASYLVAQFLGSGLGVSLLSLLSSSQLSADEYREILLSRSSSKFHSLPMNINNERRRRKREIESNEILRKIKTTGNEEDDDIIVNLSESFQGIESIPLSIMEQQQQQNVQKRNPVLSNPKAASKEEDDDNNKEPRKRPEAGQKTITVNGSTYLTSAPPTKPVVSAQQDYSSPSSLLEAHQTFGATNSQMYAGRGEEEVKLGVGVATSHLLFGQQLTTQTPAILNSNFGLEKGENSALANNTNVAPLPQAASSSTKEDQNGSNSTSTSVSPPSYLLQPTHSFKSFPMAPNTDKGASDEGSSNAEEATTNDRSRVLPESGQVSDATIIRQSNATFSGSDVWPSQEDELAHLQQQTDKLKQAPRVEVAGQLIGANLPPTTLEKLGSQSSGESKPPVRVKLIRKRRQKKTQLKQQKQQQQQQQHQQHQMEVNSSGLPLAHNNGSSSSVKGVGIEIGNGEESEKQGGYYINLLEFALPDQIMSSESIRQCIDKQQLALMPPPSESGFDGAGGSKELNEEEEKEQLMRFASRNFGQCLSLSNSSQMFVFQFIANLLVVLTYLVNVDPRRIDLGFKSLSIGLAYFVATMLTVQSGTFFGNPFHLLFLNWLSPTSEWRSEWFIYLITPLVSGLFGAFSHEYIDFSSLRNRNKQLHLRRSFYSLDNLPQSSAVCGGNGSGGGGGGANSNESNQRSDSHGTVVEIASLHHHLNHSSSAATASSNNFAAGNHRQKGRVRKVSSSSSLDSSTGAASSMMSLNGPDPVQPSGSTSLALTATTAAAPASASASGTTSAVNLLNNHHHYSNIQHQQSSSISPNSGGSQQQLHQLQNESAQSESFGANRKLVSYSRQLRMEQQRVSRQFQQAHSQNGNHFQQTNQKQFQKSSLPAGGCTGSHRNNPMVTRRSDFDSNFLISSSCSSPPPTATRRQIHTSGWM